MYMHLYNVDAKSQYRSYDELKRKTRRSIITAIITRSYRSAPGRDASSRTHTCFANELRTVFFYFPPPTLKTIFFRYRAANIIYRYRWKVLGFSFRKKKKKTRLYTYSTYHRINSFLFHVIFCTLYSATLQRIRYPTLYLDDKSIII